MVFLFAIFQLLVAPNVITLTPVEAALCTNRHSSVCRESQSLIGIGNSGIAKPVRDKTEDHEKQSHGMRTIATSPHWLTFFESVHFRTA
jgi:hypothetical protein